METKQTHNGPGIFRYSEEFKRRAIQRVMDGESILNVAKDLKTAQPTISRWYKEFNITSKDTPKKEVDKTEMEELRKQVKQLNTYVKRLERLVISELIKNTPTLSVLDRVDSMFNGE